MANLIQSAKSGSNWDMNDLLAYKSSKSPDIFYSRPLPTMASLISLDPHLLSGTIVDERTGRLGRNQVKSTLSQYEIEIDIEEGTKFMSFVLVDNNHRSRF